MPSYAEGVLSCSPGLLATLGQGNAKEDNPERGCVGVNPTPTVHRIRPHAGGAAAVYFLPLTSTRPESHVENGSDTFQTLDERPALRVVVKNSATSTSQRKGVLNLPLPFSGLLPSSLSASPGQVVVPPRNDSVKV